MSSVTTTILLILPVLALCVAAVWRCILYKRTADRQSRLLEETTETLAAVQQQLLALREKEKRRREFRDSLQQAEITTQLQKSRLSVRQADGETPPPERYRYAHSLAASGMPSAEIARILSISIHEAEQLVNLAKLAHPK